MLIATASFAVFTGNAARPLVGHGRDFSLIFFSCELLDLIVLMLVILFVVPEEYLDI